MSSEIWKYDTVSYFLLAISSNVPLKGTEMDKLLTISKKEISRLEVMKPIQAKPKTQKEAGAMLGLGERQIKRLWRRYREEAAEGLILKRRGKPSNNRTSEEAKQKMVNYLHRRYADFGLAGVPQIKMLLYNFP